MLDTARVELSIIVPVYNEALNVAGLYDEVASALPVGQFEFELIFVDDGSTDDTRQVIQALSHKDARVRLIKHVRNYGQSAALVSGARMAQYPWLVTMDGDGQNDPHDIPKLFQYLHPGRVVVFGHRTKRDDHALRRLSSRIGNGIRQSILQDGCPDTGCSLKLFSREAFLRLPHFNHLHRFLPALFKRDGYELVNVPVNHRPRRFGVSKYGVMNRLFVGVYDLIGVRWLTKRPCMPEISHD